jgi:sec-independent protein translocase protein TatA
MFGRLGPGELALIALIALVLFGGSRLSDIGKGLGEGIKNFKKGIKDDPETEPKKLELARDAPRELEAKVDPAEKKA